MLRDTLLFLTALIVLSGCGGGAGGGDDTSSIGDEPYYYQQWYLNFNRDFYEAYNIDPDASIHLGDYKDEYTGKGVKVAIIDDGLDMYHEDLRGALIASYDIATRTSDVRHTGYYQHHGTAVTGIIGARRNHKGILGVASNSQIIFLKFKDQMSDSETIELFQKAADWGADIINCSWGTYDVSDAVRDYIQNLAKYGRDGKGISIVFAVGNDNIDVGNDESAIPEVIAVGSTDTDNLRATYSNYGEHLDVVAPGGYKLGITTLDDSGDRGVATIDKNYLLAYDPSAFVGTSASAPIVTGVIALMLEKNPDLTRAEIEDILHKTSDKIGNISYQNGFNKYYGYGKINVSEIMDYLDGYYYY